MDVAVVVPWRDSGPDRAAAWRWLRQRWHTIHPAFDVVEGHGPGGPWCKALAVADGLARTAADVIVLADADVWCDGIPAALDVAAAGGWVIPHWNVHRLTPTATQMVLDGGPFQGPVVERPRIGIPGGGITVLPRGLLESVPLDPRFHGWGQEDQAVAAAWATLAGRPTRLKADLWHLWHEPQPRRDRRVGSADSARLWDRYRRAFRKPDLMRELVAEAVESHRRLTSKD